MENQDSLSHSNPLCPAATETSNMNGFPMMPMYPMAVVGSGVVIVQAGNPMEELILGQGSMEQNVPTKLVLPNPKAFTVSDIASNSSSTIDPPTLSLGLSFSADQRQTSSRHSALHAMPCFNNNGDSIISVA